MWSDLAALPNPSQRVPDNVLYYGNNLDVLRNRHDFPDESVDLVYLDPPFNSNATYNVLFRSPTGEQSKAQIEAFDDTWHWNTEESEAAFEDVMQSGNSSAANMLRAMRSFLGDNDMMAYVANMAVRLLELHRVLKRTGSLYLHCDPTASHYLKLLLDAIFGPLGFRNEITWRRTPFAGSSKARARQYPRSHDVLLFYTRGEAWTWNPPTQPYSDEYRARFKWDDKDGRGPYRKTLLKTFSQETFDRLKADNRLVEAVRPGAKWSYKQYLNESSGTTQIDDVWEDINAINPVARERLGYPTQKPEALLERIIAASSNPGDTVLDPFCGCGTTVAAAQKLARRWIGIDVTHLAIGLIERRLKDAYPGLTFRVEGTPTDFAGAEDLALRSKHQFQMWAVHLINAVPYKGGQKGADTGIDGYYYFRPDGKKTEVGIVQVKGGEKTHRNAVGELRGVMEREHAPLGVLILLRPATAPMEAEAAAGGFFDTIFGRYPRIQITTVENLLAGKVPRLPPQEIGFKKAPEDKGQTKLL